VAGALAIKLNRLSEAEQHYAEALKLQPDSPVTRMSLAVVQLQSKDPKVIADSRITLELLNTDGKLGILPLRSLVAESAAARDFARAERLSNQVLTNAQGSFGDRMLHLSILHAAGQTNFQGFLKETQQKALQHPVYIGELAGWLNQFGFASNALTWLQGLPRQVAGQGLIPLALADSYVALREWKELETYLEAEHWIGLDHIRIAMLALAIRNQSGNQSSALAWDRAIRLASDAPTALNMLAQMALNWGWIPEVEQVLWHAAGKFPKQPWPLTSLQNLYIVRHDTAGLRGCIRLRCKETRRINWPGTTSRCCRCLPGRRFRPPTSMRRNSTPVNRGIPSLLPPMPFRFISRAKRRRGLRSCGR
jgi:hypothetical protein